MDERIVHHVSIDSFHFSCQWNKKIWIFIDLRSVNLLSRKSNVSLLDRVGSFVWL